MTDKEKIYRSFRELKTYGYMAKPGISSPSEEMYPYTSYELLSRKDIKYIYYLSDFEDLFDKRDSLTAPLPVYFGGNIMDAIVAFHTYGMECKVEDKHIGLLAVYPRTLTWIGGII